VVYPCTAIGRVICGADRQHSAYAHARNRRPGERAMSILKTWKLLTKLANLRRESQALADQYSRAFTDVIHLTCA
jgi:hypothetical protein